MLTMSWPTMNVSRLAYIFSQMVPTMIDCQLNSGPATQDDSYLYAPEGDRIYPNKTYTTQDDSLLPPKKKTIDIYFLFNAQATDPSPCRR